MTKEAYCSYGVAKLLKDKLTLYVGRRSCQTANVRFMVTTTRTT